MLFVLPRRALPRGILGFAVAVAAVLAFFAVAIGLVLIGAQRSLDPAPVVAIARPGTPASPRAVTVVMHDYRFDPTPVVLVPGETIRLTVFNGGLIPHELTLGDRAVHEAWQRADAAASDARHPSG